MTAPPGRVWVDTHCHLFMVDDVVGQLQRATAAGVAWVMTPGVDAASSEAARRLSEAHPGRILWSAGLHPHDASAWSDEGDRIVEMAAAADAVGECGLDFYRNLAPRVDQFTAFRAQLELAAALGKPAIIHCRDAFADVHAILEDAALGDRAVLHCWTGGPRWTRRFADLGVTFSFAGPVTYPTGDTVRHGAAAADPSRVMVETDTPYLTPPPDRHVANEPANVVRVGEALADVWGMGVDEVAAATSATAQRVFRPR